MSSEKLFECTICLEEYGWGRMTDRFVCTFCNSPTLQRHPINGDERNMCKCGRVFSHTCQMASFLFKDDAHGPCIHH